MRQKQFFLKSEGDSWFDRNRAKIKSVHYEHDHTAQAITRVLKTFKNKEKTKILEIGCSSGLLLKWLKKHFNVDIYGIDPSKKAIKESIKNGVRAKVGTADNIPFQNNKFDIIIFGFCLYLCDRKDLRTITEEASRVLKDESWVIIKDFYSSKKTKTVYEHLPKLRSYKMDYRKIFSWNKSIICYFHIIYDHDTNRFSDRKENWVSTSILRKSKKHHE